MRKLIEYLEKDVDEKYYIKQPSMIKAVGENKIKLINKWKIDENVNTITTKQWRWNNAGAILEKVKFPFSNFNQENYLIFPKKENIRTITATGANSRQKILIPLIKKEKMIVKIKNDLYNVRVITPKESFRLMGFSDDDYEKAKLFLSETQLYKVAGNSIVVPVMQDFLSRLKDEYWPLGTFNFLDLFAGIGAVEKAMSEMGLKYNTAEIVEIDKHAVNAYNSIHNTSFKTSDIKDYTKKDINYHYIHASTPCQAFSVAGKNKGADDERGKILWEHTLRIIKMYKPKIFTLENVKGILSERHIELFMWFMFELEKMGYITGYQVVNAKHYIPQNRERVYFAAILDANKK